MPFKLLLTFVVVIITLLQVQATPAERWFKQYLDHFNTWDNRTFNQRYFESNSFYREGGPLLIMIGSEAAADPDSFRWNPSRGIAQRLHGQVVLLEHRFYGESLPFENFTSENLQYLSVDQALEDLAYFVETYKKRKPGFQNSKVAVFGCSYGAALATWFRYKFPHLVDAAWASSAPLRATLDFYEYYEVAGEMYANVSKECIAIIRQGYREAKKLMSTSKGLDMVRSTFDGWECGNVTEMNATEILSIIRLIVSDQYAAPNHSVTTCKFLESKNSSTSCFQQLAVYIIDKANDVCFEEDDNDNLAWNYQTCTQLGYVQSTTSSNQPFKDAYSVVDEHISECTENYGQDFSKDVLQRGIDRINRVYGSTNLKVSKVLTVHGTIDPWHRLGLHVQTDSEAPVLLIPGASHCSDDNDEEYPKELPQIRKTKEIGMKIMTKWLQ